MTNHCPLSIIQYQINKVRAHIPADVTLVCVSKYQPIEAIRAAYEAGERHFGESRVQELKQKAVQLPTDIHWHFIGHLQTNKVRDLLKLHPYLIESVDSEHLLQTINDEAAKLDIIQEVLLEVHVAKEETKSGFTPEDLSAIGCQLSAYEHVRVSGMMCMATNTDDETEIRRCFEEAKALHTTFHVPLSILSMGMSDDYRIAIECGSTSVRIGSAIFGERKNQNDQMVNDQMVNSQKIRAVFFDQDGVLYNSMPYHAEAWAWAMTKHGLPYTAMECYRNEGRTSTGVIQEHHLQMYGSDATPELIEAIYKDKTAYFTEKTGGFPGIIPDVDKVLQYLHDQGIECWVVTGSGQRDLINALNKTFNNVFKGIISSFDVQYGKPNPEPYLKAWERCGFKKEECMVVENAPLGVRAAKAAGLFTCAVNTGILPDSELAAEHADLIFHSMQELSDWFKHHA